MRIIFLYLFLAISLVAQTTVNDYVKLLSKKIFSEFNNPSNKNYLDLYLLELDDEIPGIKKIVKANGNIINLKRKNNEQIKYYIYYSKPKNQPDNVIPLFIDYETKIIRSSTPGQTTPGKRDEGIDIAIQQTEEKLSRNGKILVNIKDMLELKFTDSLKYLYDKICKVIISKTTPSEFTVSTDDIMKEKPVYNVVTPDFLQRRSDLNLFYEDNTGLVDNMHVTNPHKIPFLLDTNKAIDLVDTSSFFKVSYADVSFSRLSICVNGLSSLFAIGIGKVGFEFNNEDKVLGYLPLQSPYFNYGINFFFSITGNEKNYKDNFFTAIKLMMRTPHNSLTLLKNYPGFAVENPLINVTQGFSLEAQLSKGWISSFFNNFPCLYISYSTGNENYSNPCRMINRLDDTKLDSVIIGKHYDCSFYSRTQWKSYLSFFWKMQGVSNFRLDLGAGSFDVTKSYASLDTVGTSSFVTKMSTDKYVSPVIAFEYNAISIKELTPLMGVRLEYFNSRINCNLWLRIFKFYGDVRLESFMVTKPIMRSLYDWETDGGLFVQLRWRYGF